MLCEKYFIEERITLAKLFTAAWCRMVGCWRAITVWRLTRQLESFGFGRWTRLMKAITRVWQATTSEMPQRLDSSKFSVCDVICGLWYDM